MRKTTLVVISCLAVAVVLLGIALVRKGRRVVPFRRSGTTFQAVLLDTGQVYYGKLSRLGTEYPRMTDVYYIVSNQDPQTKAVKRVLVKRGNELHAPTETFLNARHIVMIEPVGPSSQVAKLIAQSEANPQGQEQPPANQPAPSPPSQ